MSEGRGLIGSLPFFVTMLITTAKLSDVDPLAWLADVLQRLPDHPASRVHELLPWAWKPQPCAEAA